MSVEAVAERFIGLLMRQITQAHQADADAEDLSVAHPAGWMTIVLRMEHIEVDGDLYGLCTAGEAETLCEQIRREAGLLG